VETTRLAAAGELRVDLAALVDALTGAGEDHDAVARRLAGPSRLAGQGDEVETLRGALRGRLLGLAVVGDRQGAGDRGLLDDIDAADPRGQWLEPAALRACLVDQGFEIVAGALATVVLMEHPVAQRGGDAIGFERRVVLKIDRLRIAALEAIERRLGDVEIAAVDQRLHLAVEEGQKQGADVAAVDVGVGHDDDAVIARLVGLEILAADAGAERLNQRPDLRRPQHLVEPRALDVENLALQRQDGLEAAVAALFGRAAGAVALDDEDLALCRVALLAIGELAREIGDVERALAAGQVPGLARGLAGGGGLGYLGDDLAGVGRVLLEPLLQPVAD